MNTQKKRHSFNVNSPIDFECFVAKVVHVDQEWLKLEVALSCVRETCCRSVLSCFILRILLLLSEVLSPLQSGPKCTPRDLGRLILKEMRWVKVLRSHHLFLHFLDIC